ncbi:MAG: branched-chain amino acid aminotransferase [Maioricimonas sp. JB045]|uniref:branched-chain amino acid aminotransferase n=1 Tax=Maioricimonas sp. JC845 TaxID=3232138 RepID=UPI00345AD264
MMHIAESLWNDEAGFIVSAELVLVATIVVLGLIVGLSEVSIAINEELEDVGSAFGSINQSYAFSGAAGCKGAFGGSYFEDSYDMCDEEDSITCDGGSFREGW